MVNDCNELTSVAPSWVTEKDYLDAVLAIYRLLPPSDVAILVVKNLLDDNYQLRSYDNETHRFDYLVFLSCWIDTDGWPFLGPLVEKQLRLRLHALITKLAFQS